MPRCEDQNIPTALLADYLRTLGPTRYDASQYGSNPDARDLVAQKYPPTSKNTRTPSPAQLAQRDIFKTCANGFRDMPDNEQRAYFEVARPSDMYFYDFAMSRNIKAMLLGASWDSLRYPRAASYDYDNNPQCAYLQIETPTNAVGTVRWNVEAGQATYAFGCEEPIFTGFELIEHAGLYIGGSWTWFFANVWTFGTTRTSGSKNIVYTQGAPDQRWRYRIQRSSTDQTPCVIWDLSFNYTQPNLTASNFFTA